MPDLEHDRVERAPEGREETAGLPVHDRDAVAVGQLLHLAHPAGPLGPQPAEVALHALIEDPHGRKASAGARGRVTGLMDAGELRALFDAPAPFTVGIEEEVLLLDPATLELAERAPELPARLGGCAPFKPEFPAAQLELVTGPDADVFGCDRAIWPTGGGRCSTAPLASQSRRRQVSTPSAPRKGGSRKGPATRGPGRSTGRSRGGSWWAALQVHVAVGGAERTLGGLQLAAAAPARARRDCSQRPM